MWSEDSPMEPVSTFSPGLLPSRDLVELRRLAEHSEDLPEVTIGRDRGRGRCLDTFSSEPWSTGASEHCQKFVEALGLRDVRPKRRTTWAKCWESAPKHPRGRGDSTSSVS